MIIQHAIELSHEGNEPFLAHRRNSFKPVSPLIEERQLSLLIRVRLQGPIQTGGLAGRAEEGDERLRDGEEEDESVAALGMADAHFSEANAEPRIFEIAEGLLNCEAASVERENLGGGEIRAVGSEAPRFFHGLL